MTIPHRRRFPRIAASMALAMGIGLSGGAVQAQEDEKIIKSFVYSTFGGEKYKEGFDHLDYVNPDAPKGGEISIWAQGTFDSMNPFSRKGRAGSMASIGMERILMDTADDAYGTYCLLCTEMEYPESEDWVIFHLRDDITFNDGTPATAHDIVFTVDLLLEQALPSFREAVKKLYKSVEALDDYTVKFTFQDDVPRKTLIVQAGSTPMLSQKWYEETGARLDESRLEPDLVTGPYMLDSYDINRRITYKRNPDYWGADLPINKGRNNFDTIRVEYFGDSNAALEGFKAGAYTFRQETSSLTWATAYDFPAVTKGQIVKAELPNGNIPTASGFVFNLRREMYQDRRVREALGLMFNFEWTNTSLQYGLFKQRQSFWENSDLAAQGVPEGPELELLQGLGDQIDPVILTEEAVTFPQGAERQLDRRALRRAATLLEEAGWTAGADGMRVNAAGERLTLELLSYNPTFDRIFIPFIDNLRTLGVDAKYERVDPAQYTNRTRAFDYDMIYDAYSNGPEEGIGMSQKFGKDDAEYSQFNPAGYGSDAVNAMIDKVVDATSLEEMKLAVRAADRIMRFERFMIPTWYNDTYWVAYYDMFAHPDELPPYDMGYLDFWWYDADKAQALKEAGAL